MQMGMKSVITYKLYSDGWRILETDARQILTDKGMYFKNAGATQKVEFTFQKPTTLNSFSIEGPVDKVTFTSRNTEGEEVRVTIEGRGTGNLKSHSTKWDRISVELPSLLRSETLYRVSFEVRDFARMKSFRKVLASQASEEGENTLVLMCAEKAEVKVDFLIAMASSKLVRRKFNNTAFNHETDRTLDLSGYNASTVENLAHIMMHGVINLEHVNSELIALMDYLLIDGWEVVWELVRGSMSSENCIERMRLAQTHSNAETMMVGFQLALGDDTREAEAISIIRESFHLFDVVNAKAFFGALVAK